MKKIRVKAYAKINLTLDILGTNGGYHNIRSLVATIDLFDAVNVQTRKDSLVNIQMRGMNSEGIPHEGNNAAKAAELFVKTFNTCGCDIYVDKNIPMGAGLGGSSADAAAVLNALAALYDVKDFTAVKQIADEVGSDTGYMLTGGYAVIEGRGCVVTPVESDLRLDLLLLLPEGGVSTAECYRRYDSLGVKLKHTTDSAVTALTGGDRAALGKSISNALFPPARTLCGEIAKAYESLQGFAPCGVNMTGSGSCVYALCENDMFARYMASRMSVFTRLIQAKTIKPKKIIMEDTDG